MCRHPVKAFPETTITRTDPPHLLSTWPPPGKKSHAAWIASLPSKTRLQWLRGLSDNARAALPWLFSFWANAEHQLPPSTPANWRTWVVLGGRGAGKTRTGSEWIRSLVEGPTPLAPGRRRRIALIGETADQARDVMVLGDSGLLACSPADRRPVLHVSRRRLTWANGAEAMLFSAKDPDSLRGPQFDAAWCDELGKWQRAEAAWSMLQFALRIGPHPQAVVTTTPRRNPVLWRLLDDPSVARTTARTADNAAHLAASFLEEVSERYANTALGRQELDGEDLRDLPGGLWSRDLLARSRIEITPPLDRIIVAVDPAVTSHRSADTCGIIIAGRRAEATETSSSAVVLADWSVQGATPRGWAERAITAYHDFNADCLVAEVNQGGDMVETILRQVDDSIAFRPLHASRGKIVRAEPVAALYEQDRISHMKGLDLLEDDLCALSRYTGWQGRGRSPDRVDALVWAITELLLRPQSTPRVRHL